MAAPPGRRRRPGRARRGPRAPGTWWAPTPGRCWARPGCPRRRRRRSRYSGSRPARRSSGGDVTEANLVQEAGLESVAVSFDKGCYLGQETVARAQYRGRVNRRLRGLRLDAPAAPGAAVRLDGEEVGRVGSAVLSPALGPIALALLPRAAAPGAEVEVPGGGPATVVDLPFR